MPSRREPLAFPIVSQPTETSCGPTCLDAVYRYWGRPADLSEIIEQIPENEDGGTFSVILAIHALRRGYRATIFSYNLRVFDPTWFDLPPPELRAKLRQRAAVIRSKKAKANIEAYDDFLELGGIARFDELTPALLADLLSHGRPIIAGLSATHLYRHIRALPDGQDDDVRGEAEGHFVVLFAYDLERDLVHIADPYLKNPLANANLYTVGVQRLINAIMLGIVTYDANLLIIEPEL